jgi:hypothetical protein
MFASLPSAALFGVEAYRVDVEVDISGGLPAYHVVGLPAASVKEGATRIRSALRNAGQDLPSRKVTVNLAPADRRKEGAAFELPLFVGVGEFLEQLVPVVPGAIRHIDLGLRADRDLHAPIRPVGRRVAGVVAIQVVPGHRLRRARDAGGEIVGVEQRLDRIPLHAAHAQDVGVSEDIQRVAGIRWVRPVDVAQGEWRERVRGSMEGLSGHGAASSTSVVESRSVELSAAAPSRLAKEFYVAEGGVLRG